MPKISTSFLVARRRKTHIEIFVSRGSGFLMIYGTDLRSLDRCHDNVSRDLSVRTGGYEITIFPVVRESLSGRATGILFSGIGHPKRGSMDVTERTKITEGKERREISSILRNVMSRKMSCLVD